jgi:competence protein ComEC
MRNRILIIMAGFLLIAAYLVSRPDGKVRVIFCDVGQGDGAIIWQNQTEILIDVGPENKKMVECLGRYLPFWDKKIETVVLTHGDKDHTGGLAEVEKHYQIEQKYSSVDLKENDVIRFGEVVFQVVSPAIMASPSAGLDNENSVVGELSVGGRIKVLFMGDVTKEVEQRLVWRGVLTASNAAATKVLKVSHHGSAEGTSEELLETVQPKIAVISVGNNKFGHPAKEVIGRLQKFGVEVKRTDEVGDVVMVL